MPPKPLRRIAKSWAKSLRRMYGFPARAKVTQSRRTFDRLTGLRGTLPANAEGEYSIKTRKRKAVGVMWINPHLKFYSQFLTGISEKQMTLLISAHELGHGLLSSARKGENVGRFLDEFFSTLSAYECAKKNLPMFYKKLTKIKNYIVEVEYVAAADLAETVMESFQNAGQRNKIIRELLLSDVNTYFEAIDFLRKKGLKNFRRRYDFEIL